MTPSGESLPQSNNRDHIAVEVPLPGYYDVIASDFYNIRHPGSRGVIGMESSLKDETSEDAKVTEFWRRVREWVAVSPQSEPDGSNRNTRSYTNWFSVFCRTLTLIFVLLMIVISLLGIGI